MGAGLRDIAPKELLVAMQIPMSLLRRVQGRRLLLLASSLLPPQHNRFNFSMVPVARQTLLLVQ